MKKFILVLLLFISSFNFVFSEDINEKIENIKNEITKNVKNIKETIRKYQIENNYIDFTYPDVEFLEGNNDFINVEISIKNPQWDIIDYNWLLKLEPLIFWTSFNFWEIPKSLNIVNWVWELNISVSQVDDGLIDEESWLWLIISSENNDLIWNILTFAYWANSIDINNYISKIIPIINEDNKNIQEGSIADTEYRIYNPEKPNIYWYKSVTLNNNWEFVVEYDTNYYERLLKVFGWKWILWFDKTSNYKYNLNYDIENKDNSVFITILKDDKIIDIYKYYASINNNLKYGDWDGKIPKTFFGNISSLLINYIWMTYNLYEYYDEKFIRLLSELNIKWLWEFFNENSLDIYNTENIWENLNITYEEFKNNYSYDFGNGYILNNLNWNNIRFILEKAYSSDKWSYKKFLEEYLIIKYNNFYKEISDYSSSFSFDIIKDEKEIKEFLLDNMYYDLPIIIKNNTWNLYLNKKNEIFYISKNEKEINSLTLNLNNWKKWESIHCNDSWDDDPNNGCHIWNNFNNKFPKEYLIDNIRYENWNVYVNISNFFNTLQQNWILSWYKFEHISNININLDNFSYPYIKDTNILPITENIKSPKTISTNPYLISVNFILALLYLFAFYFTAQLFNFYFEELSSKNKWNEKIASILKKCSKLPLNKLYDLLIKKNNPKLKLYTNKTRNFLIKYEHKIYIIIWFLILWIIGQIVVDDFDILSLKWWFTILIMIFILAFITLFKDMLLYIFNKWKARETLKLENIPVWFIFAWIVAIFGRWIWLIPWVMFGSTIKLDAKSNLTSRQTSKPTLLLKVLLIVFLVWLASWFLTIPFDSSSFIYKFLIVTYFGLVNDVFFALLPFGMLWWIYILKDKKLRIKWFIFTFIIFFFLLHTVLHWEGDLNKILQFDWNFAILVWILFFWILATWILYYINNKKVISK